MNTRNDHQGNVKSLFWEHSQCLPPFFAENILYLEMEVECNNVTIEVVNQLLELYRIGVEYFESIKSNKFLIFKNKTQQLLMKGTVNQCMNVAYEELKHETALKKSKHIQSHDILPPPSPKVIIPQKSQKQQELENQLKYIKEQDQKLQNFMAMNLRESQEYIISSNNNYDRALQEQEDQVQIRLQRRRMKSVKIKGQKE